MMKNCVRRSALGVLAAAAALSAAGCATGGAYTRQGTSLAKEKMNVLKSATDWEMSRQAFLAGDLDKALKKIDVSLSINPGVAKSHVLKGRILLEEGEIGLGVQSLQTALAIEPDNIDANYYMGIAQERLSNIEQAFSFYDKAARLDSYNDQYPVAAAEMLIDLNRLEDAEKYLRQQPTFDTSAGVRQTLGHIAKLEHKLPEAIDSFRSAQLLAPDDMGILEDLTRAQFENGNFADAEYGLSTLLGSEQCADRRDLKRMQAECLVKVNRLGDARKLYRDLTNDPEGPSDADSWLGLGNVSFSIKDFTTARRAATRVVAIAPDRPGGYVLWALLHRQEGNLEASARSFQDAIARDSRNPALHTMLAMTLFELNHKGEARKAVETALALDPGNRSATAMLARLDRQVAGVDTQEP